MFVRYRQCEVFSIMQFSNTQQHGLQCKYLSESDPLNNGRECKVLTDVFHHELEHALSDVNYVNATTIR